MCAKSVSFYLGAFSGLNNYGKSYESGSVYLQLKAVPFTSGVMSDIVNRNLKVEQQAGFELPPLGWQGTGLGSRSQEITALSHYAIATRADMSLG